MSTLATKPIKGCPGYFVSKEGAIYSNKRGDLMKMKPNVFQGYERIKMIRPDGTIRNAQVHRIVAETFIKKVRGKILVNHIDGNKSNNAVNNLEWTDHYGNARHYQDKLLPGYKKQKIKVKQSKQDAKLSVVIYAHNAFKDFPEEFYNTFGQIFSK